MFMNRHGAASKLTIIIACCLGAAIVLGGGIWGITALRIDPVARQLELGHKYLEEGNYQQAILAFEEAIEIEPMSIEARLGLAKVYVALGDQDKAEQVLEDAMEIDPSRPEPYLALAEIYLDQGREQEAVDTYLQAIANAPANPDAYLALAKLYLDQDMPHEALAVLESFPGTDSEIEGLFEELTSVASVELDREKLWLVVGEIWTLRAVIEPVTAQDQSVQWSSSDIDVAEVSSEGVVTAKAEGTTVITVASFDGNRTASIEVEVEDYLPGALGNTGGNIVNGGLVATDGTWIYFRGNNIYQSISRMLPDGSQAERLDLNWGNYINVIDGWIYYQSGPGRIYRMRTNGTDRELLSGKGIYITVVDGWIYYSDPNIHRMRPDGSGKEKLNDDYSTCLNVAGGWIYYVNSDDRWSIYRIRTDGSVREKLNDNRSEDVNVLAGWIYYVNRDSGSRIYRMRSDGSTVERLNDDSSSNIHVFDGWIYYVNRSEGSTIYRIRLDRTDREQLNNNRSHQIHVVDGWVYYVNRDVSYSRSLYRMRLDGSDQENMP